MRIEHLAIWCDDIEAMRAFYMMYFDCNSNAKYHNAVKQFSSYFLSFPDGDSRIELMARPDIADGHPLRGFYKGLAHFDLEVGTEEDVVSIVERLRVDGHKIVSECRRTGDGYFEAAILDPEGNYVELSASIP